MRFVLPTLAMAVYTMAAPIEERQSGGGNGPYAPVVGSAGST